MKMSELNNGEKFLVEKIELAKNIENMFESLSFEAGKIYTLVDKDDNKFKIKFISNSFDAEEKKSEKNHSKVELISNFVDSSGNNTDKNFISTKSKIENVYYEPILVISKNYADKIRVKIIGDNEDFFFSKNRV